MLSNFADGLRRSNKPRLSAERIDLQSNCGIPVNGSASIANGVGRSYADTSLPADPLRVRRCLFAGLLKPTQELGDPQDLDVVKSPEAQQMLVPTDDDA